MEVLPTDGEAQQFDRQAVAQTLVDAWYRGTFVPAPSKSRSFTLDDALAIGELVRESRVGAGAVPLGYKVGFTNGAVRDQFAAPGPLAATVYDDTLNQTRIVDAHRLLGPRIEPEIVIGVGADGEPAWAALGFEIVQSHIANWEFGYLDAVADFGLHAGLIVGERRAMSADDARQLLSMTVELSLDGAIVERGTGSDVDGGILGSLTWLRNDLRRVDRELLEGDIISTGSMTRVPTIAAGQRWTIAAVGKQLPELTIRIT